MKRFFALVIFSLLLLTAIICSSMRTKSRALPYQAPPVKQSAVVEANRYAWVWAQENYFASVLHFGESQSA